MVNLIVALALANPFIVAWDKERPESTMLKRAVVTGVEQAQVASGDMAMWSRIDVRTAKGEPMALFRIYLAENNPPLPPKGATCDFTYRMDQLGGSAGPGLDTSRNWPMVEDFSCRPG